jgi:hypothetical protein
MGYRIRILGRNLSSAPLKELQQLAHPASLQADEGVENDWEALTLKHASGVPIALIERNPVIEGQLGFDELQEFIEEVPYHKPESASAWLREYLPGVKIIYSFQLLSGTDIDDGFSVMHKVYGRVWQYAGGILQADQEGFTNEVGSTILWQFENHVTGPWNAGVLDANGQWVNFEMDLGNQIQREAFLRGEVPPEVERLPDNARLLM